MRQDLTLTRLLIERNTFSNSISDTSLANAAFFKGGNVHELHVKNSTGTYLPRKRIIHTMLAQRPHIITRN
jgi:hypothetical protein